MDWSSKSWSETVVNNSKFSVDLKLGRLEDVGVMSMKNSGDLPLNMASSNSTSSSAKRGRGRHGRAQSCASCLVDECSADLSDCREYYRRHRVCERHSKTPVVVIGGIEKRFCQQCSRFQSLGEFDEVKRSCRKRLEGHNRRRRKTQPETFYMTSAGLQSSQTQTGNRLLQFWSTSQKNTPNRPVISQLEEKTSHYGHHHHQNEHQTFLPDSLSWGTKEEKHYTLLSDMISHQTVHQQRLLNGATASMGITRDRVTHSSVSVQSECALSLLSTYPTTTQSSGGTYTGQITMQPTMMTLTSSSAEGIGVATALHLEDESSVSLSSSTSNNNNAHSFGGFQQSGHIGFCENGSSRIFPFAWE